MKSDPERARRLTTAQAAYAGIALDWDRKVAEWATRLRLFVRGLE
jgi:hypothetical protein